MMGSLANNWIALEFGAIDKEIASWPKWMKVTLDDLVTKMISAKYQRKANEEPVATGLSVDVLE